MQTSKKLPIALIGCGRWGQYILRDLNALQCDVTVVCHSSASVERAKQYGAKKIVSAITQLEKPAGIVIATPTSTHLDVIEDVLHFNVPIFVEKPLGTNLTKAKAIVEKAGETIFVMDKWRYHRGIEALTAIATSQEFGEIIGLTIKQSGWGCPHVDVDFIDILLPHSIAIMHEILGQIPRPQQCYVIKRHHDVVGLQGLFGTQPWCNVSVVVNSPYYEREIMLECAAGVAVLKNAYSTAIEIYDPCNSQKNALMLIEKRAVATDMPLLRELRVFLDYLRGDAPPKSDAYTGIAVMETIAQLRALASGSVT